MTIFRRNQFFTKANVQYCEGICAILSVLFANSNQANLIHRWQFVGTSGEEKPWWGTGGLYAPALSRKNVTKPSKATSAFYNELSRYANIN